jgi:hypothetical protein
MRDIYVIGGGPSLKGFDWGLLEGRETIGCNAAYLLGSAICGTCVFGDADFLRDHIDRLRGYKGDIVTNVEGVHVPSFVDRRKRQMYGLSDDPSTLAWNHNTGALAINLALQRGADRVLLLGFDSDTGPQNQQNWHRFSSFRHTKAQSGEVHARFRTGFAKLAAALPSVFPNSIVLNLNPDSRLSVFTINDWRDFLYE